MMLYAGNVKPRFYCIDARFTPEHVICQNVRQVIKQKKLYLIILSAFFLLCNCRVLFLRNEKNNLQPETSSSNDDVTLKDPRHFLLTVHKIQWHSVRIQLQLLSSRNESLVLLPPKV